MLVKKYDNGKIGKKSLFPRFGDGDNGGIIMKQNTKKNSALPYTTLTGEQLGSGSIGDVRIYSDVIASIIKKSVSEVPGVSRISDRSVIDNISGFLSSRKF